MTNRYSIRQFSPFVLAPLCFLFTLKCQNAASAELPAQSESVTHSEASDLVFFSFDDYSIPWRDNLKLTLEQPRKHPGNPVLRSGPPGSVDSLSADLYGTVLKIGDKFRMWYTAWAQPDSRYPDVEDYSPVAYAESSDGIHWEKPNLGLVEFRGSKNNNLALIDHGPGEFGRPANNFVCVIYDSEDPEPNRRYKMAYNTLSPRRYSTTATAVSRDGLRWKVVNNSEFTSGGFENSSLIRFQGMYYTSGQNLYPYGGHLLDGTPAGRTMTVFYSPDFKHWSGGRALSFFRSNYEPKTVNYGRELHMGAALWNRGNVIVGLYGRWHGDTIRDQKQPFMRTAGSKWKLNGLKMDLGLVLSNDAIHYREPVRDFVVIPYGKENEWDSEAIQQGNAFCNTDTETYIWYSHWDTDAPWPIPPFPEKVQTKPQAIGLATMRRDGFGYLSKLLTEPVEFWRGKWERAEASLVTRPVRLRHPARMYLNVAEVSPSSPLTVELVDDTENALSGYEAVSVKKSSVKSPVEWSSRRTLRIRITWPPSGKANPRLYALYLEKQ